MHINLSRNDARVDAFSEITRDYLRNCVYIHLLTQNILKFSLISCCVKEF